MRLSVETIHKSPSVPASIYGPEGPVEAEDFSRLEGEGGREGLISDLADVQFEKTIGQRPHPVTTRNKPGKSMKPFPASGARQGLRIRKQIYELTRHDLSTFPVWEFRLDEEGEEGRDESTVRPYTASGPLDPADRMFVVRAVFTLADGSKMPGYFTPPGRGDSSIGTLQPIIVTGRGQVRLWCGKAAPDSKRLAQSYELLGKDAAQVFPIQFESNVELAGGPVRGSVPGFLVMEDFQTRRTRTVL